MATKIMAVDDEWTHIQLLKAILSQAGFQAITEGDSRNALALAKAEHPEVILLDVNMPSPSGYEVFEQLRGDADTKYIPIIMVTARAQKTEIERGQQMGADDYVTKPFEPEELVGCIRRVLSRKRETP